MAKENRNLNNSLFTTGLLGAAESSLTFESGKLLGKNGKKITAFNVRMGTEVYPELDAIIVVGDNLRAAKDAAEYLKLYNRKYAHYPEVLCVPGFSQPKWLRYETPTVEWLRRIMMALDVPERIVYQHNLLVDEQDLAEAVRDFVLTTDWGKIGVFSSRGYSLPVAQQLYCLLPEIRWYFNENAPVLPEDRIFRSEIVGPDGWAIDAIVANVAKSYQCLGTKRLRLSDNCFGGDEYEDHPYIKLVQKMVSRGYVGCLCSYRDWDFYGISARDGIAEVFIRRDDFPVSMGSDEDIMSCVNKLIEQYRE